MFEVYMKKDGRLVMRSEWVCGIVHGLIELGINPSKLVLKYKA